MDDEKKDLLEEAYRIKEAAEGLQGQIDSGKVSFQGGIACPNCDEKAGLYGSKEDEVDWISCPACGYEERM